MAKTPIEPEVQEPEVPVAADPIEPVAADPEVIPGFHVMHNGQSLGVYPASDDAEAFANGHPRANGLEVEVIEVTG